ncbi:MAG: CDP-alcohol phosphatidyltransferase [Dysgonamonadaceae bacterium]|nr:CDP-alcohol phosphatidyltransferase [Dysgonamonadaceae bacterium]
MKDSANARNKDSLLKITKDRSRTNILKKHEQQLLVFLVQRVPSWITSNMLTGIGFAGSFITAGSFILAAYFQRTWLLLGILGFIINWFGDSLDGRLAYFRNRPRKWYGFSLDFIVDWLTNILIGCGFIVYDVSGQWGLVGFGFVVLYGWAMMMALLRYKIIDQYTIDSGIFGPTEVRILLSLILVIEVIFKDTIVYSALIACIILLILNIKDFRKLLKMADRRDKDERANALKGQAS